MSGVSIDVNEQPVVEVLSQLIARGQNLEPPFRDVGEYLLIATQQRFADETAPDGTPWAPLSERYQARKKKNADKILVLDGYLQGTLRYQASADELAFGTDRIYGAAQQFGREEINLPAREFLGLSADDETEVLDIFGGYLLPA